MLERALGVRRDVPGGPDPIYDDAREHLYERLGARGAARAETSTPLNCRAEPEWTNFSETDGASYRVTFPVRPQVKLGDYANFPFKPADRRRRRRQGRRR